MFVDSNERDIETWQPSTTWCEQSEAIHRQRCCRRFGERGQLFQIQQSH